MIQSHEIVAAGNRIKDYVHHTPILSSQSINKLTGAQLYFKCENFQKVGAFKYRGATNAVLQLSSAELKNGVITHSSGNHAQALALAAKKSGIKCYVVMPSNSPQVKVAAVKSYGAEITFCPPTLEDRERYTENIIKRTNATFIHPYNNLHIITGQATCAKEFMDEMPDLDTIIAPVGGGGLLAGTLLACKYFSSKTNVFGAEPEGANDAYRSLRSGILVKTHQPHTIADGLLTTLGDLNWPIIKEYVTDILTVSDEEIKWAMTLVMQRLKIIIEPSSATVLAAVLKHKSKFEGKKVGLIISGGNFDPTGLK